MLGQMKKMVHWMMMVAVSLVLAACQNQDEKPSVVVSTQKSEVNIGRLICGGHLPLAVVESMYQDDLPFHLRTVQNHSWDDVVQDMKSGKLAGTFILSPLAMNLIKEGLPAKIVLMGDRNGNGFVLSKKYHAIANLAEQPVIIAVPHLYSQHHVLAVMALKQAGVPLSKVTILPMPPRDMVNSLSRGEIDGFVVGEPEGNRSISVDVGWMATISPMIWSNHMDHVFIASDAFIEEHPEQLQALVQALLKAGAFIEEHPHEAAKMGEDYTGAKADVFEQVLSDPPDWIRYDDMVPTATDLRDMAEKLVEMGLWDEVPADLARYADLRFVQAVGK